MHTILSEHGKMRLNIILTSALIVLLAINGAIAIPAITSTSGNWVHGTTGVTISGSGFGTKSNPAPAFWDDGEGVHTLASKYDYARPNAADDSTHDMAYRSGTFRNMSNPHGNGSRYLSGGHTEEYGTDYNQGNGSNVGVIVDIGSTFTVLYATWYEAWDPLWPTNAYYNPQPFAPNHKFLCYEITESMYGGGHTYVDYSHNKLPAYSSTIQQSQEPVSGGYDFPRSMMLGAWARSELFLNNANDTTDMFVIGPARSVANSRIMDNDSSDGDDQLTVPATMAYLTLGGYMCFQTDVTTVTGWESSDSEYRALLASDTALLIQDLANTTMPKGTVGALTTGQWGYAGGYAYVKDNPAGHTYHATDTTCGSIGTSIEHGGHNDAFRYYDDIYVDTTYSRVMLGDASTITACTVLEPQIPSAWADGSITVKVNMGALSGSSYLYVFDSTNTANTNGFPINPPQMQGVSITGVTIQ